MFEQHEVIQNRFNNTRKKMKKKLNLSGKIKVWIYCPTRSYRMVTISTCMYNAIPTVLIGLNKCSNKVFSFYESVKNVPGAESFDSIS